MYSKTISMLLSNKMVKEFHSNISFFCKSIGRTAKVFPTKESGLNNVCSDERFFMSESKLFIIWLILGEEWNLRYKTVNSTLCRHFFFFGLNCFSDVRNIRAPISTAKTCHIFLTNTSVWNLRTLTGRPKKKYSSSDWYFGNRIC